MPCEKQLREQLVQAAEEAASGGFTQSFPIPTGWQPRRWSQPPHVDSEKRQ